MLARNVSDLSEKFRNSYFPENLAAIKLLAKSEQKFPIKAAVFRSTPASQPLSFLHFVNTHVRYWKGGKWGLWWGLKQAKR